MNYKTEKNKFGISVNKGCISCEHGCNNGRERRCQNLNAADYAQKVKKDHVCDCWRMKRGLQAAGRGDGKVKRKSYLLALLESTDSRESIQKEYEKKFGSIYLINK